MPTTVWVATADIHVGSGASFVLGYTPGNVVPDSVVTALGLAGSGLVQQATISDAGTSTNWRGTDPITRSELDEILSGLGGGTTDPEIVRDTIGGALVAGSGVQITVNDAGDTVTVASTAVLPARQVLSGTGLSGGGDLSADRTLAVTYGTTAGTAAEGNDSRITGAVQTSRQVISGTGLSGGGTLAADRTLAVTYGTAAGTAVQGNDSRVTADQAAATASIRTLGSGAQQAKPGNYQPTAANISDASTVGRTILTAPDAAAVRTASGSGRVDSSDASIINVVKVTAAAHAALVTAGTTVATTLYILVG